MSDQVQFGYNPNVWQERYHKSMIRHTCLVGGFGTTDLNSRIFDCELGGYISIRDLIKYKRRPVVLSQTKYGWTKVKASMPYLEGFGPMYKVKTSSGKTIYVGDQHRFLTNQGFQRTCDLSVGSLLCVPTNLLSKSHDDVLCGLFEIEKASDCQDDCFLDLDLCDEQPLSLKEAVQSFAPSLYEQFCHDGSFYDGFYQKSPQTKQHSSPLKISLLGEQSRAFLYEESDVLVLPQLEDLGLLESENKSNLSWQDVLSCQHKDLKPIPSYDYTVHDIRWKYLADHTFYEELKGDTSILSRLAQDILGDQTILEDSLSLPKHTLLQPLQDRCHFEEVESIEYVGIRAYFDIHVPLTQNYVAEGLVHHNSGKTTAACMEHIALALEYPGSRWVVGRKTLPSLRITILKSFLSALPRELIRDYNKAQLHLTLMNGSEFIFLPLDDPEKLKSLEIAGFIIEEANEVEKEIYDRLKDRMRQALPNGTRPRYKSTIMLNPTDEEHWIPQLFLFQKPKNHELFQSSTIDNMLNVPEDYVDELKRTYGDAEIERVIYGNFSRIHKGRPVFPTFNKNHHVKIFEYDENTTLVRGWDFGFNHPVCSWLQLKNDQVRVLATLKGKRIYLDDFINGTKDFVGVRRFQEELFGPNRNTKDYCDPRGSDETDKGVTSISILNRNGIFPVYRRTWIEEGLDAMKMKIDTKCRLTGEPNLIVHPRCKNLIEGFLGGYHRDEDDTPVKDNLYDNDMDSVRYPIIHMVQQAAINRQLARQDFNRAYVNPHTGRRVDL